MSERGVDGRGIGIELQRWHLEPCHVRVVEGDEYRGPGGVHQERRLQEEPEVPTTSTRLDQAGQPHLGQHRAELQATWRSPSAVSTSRQSQRHLASLIRRGEGEGELAPQMGRDGARRRASRSASGRCRRAPARRRAVSGSQSASVKASSSVVGGRHRMQCSSGGLDSLGEPPRAVALHRHRVEFLAVRRRRRHPNCRIECDDPLHDRRLAVASA